MERLQQLRMFQRLAFSAKYLLITNLTIAFGISALGDILEQLHENYREKANTGWDALRTRNMGITGCLVEILAHYWYLYLDEYMPEHDIKAVVQKILLDQIICAPICVAATFISLGMLEGESMRKIWRNLNTKAVQLYLSEWLIWPIAQFINFYWISLRYRVLYDNLISLGFDMYISYLNHNNEYKIIETDGEGGRAGFEQDGGNITNVIMHKIKNSFSSLDV